VTQELPPLVIVTGAAGFVGRHVCRALSRQGCVVVGLGHGRWTETEWRGWGLSRFVDGDVDLPALDALALERPPRAIVHCAGSSAVSFSYAQPLGDFQRAVDTTAAVLEWQRLNAPKDCRMVLVSSAAIYGDQGDVDLVEGSSHTPISPYGFHKAMAEQLCDSYSRFFGLHISMVRLFSVYGEGLRKQLLWDAANKFANGERRFFGTGHELRDWIHVEDAARLLAAAALKPQRTLEVYNGGHTQLTTSQILTLLASQFSDAIQPEFTGETHSGNPRRLTSDSRHTMDQLDWAPQTSIEDGLRAYAAWFKTAR
jgi:UDP-glucose 4-epimerase